MLGPEDIDECPPDELGMVVSLSEMSRHHARAELPRAGERKGAPAEQPEEVRLTRTVRAENGHPLAVEDFEVERAHQAGELELLTGNRADSCPAAGQPHLHLLLRRRRLWRSLLLELFQPGTHRVVLRGHVGGDS